MGDPHLVAVHKPAAERPCAPTDLLGQFAAEGLLRRFSRLEVAPEEAPVPRGHDALHVVAQLQQPVILPLQHGEGHGQGHRGCCR